MRNSKPNLKSIFNKSEPLGPSHVKSREMFVEELLIRDNQPFARMLDKPSYLVGRKGSGKSSLLYSAYLDSESISLELPSDDLFGQIVDFINLHASEYASVEQIESVWKFALWAAISSKLLSRISKKLSNSTETKQLKTFISGLGVNVDDEPFVIILDALKYLAENPPSDLTFTQAARYSSINNITLSDIELSVDELLRKEGLEMCVIIDSLEQYKLNYKGSLPALSGFIRFVGQYVSQSSRIHIRCSLPSEVFYPILEQISSNPAKDLSRVEIVHWSSAEILVLVAKRLSVFIKLYSPEVYRTKIRSLQDLTPRDFRRRFWKIFLPERLENELGIVERADAYIMRHTQLSPRHAIMYFNEIARLSVDNILAGKPIPGECIIKAIKEIEPMLCEDVLAGWSNNYDFESVDYHYHGFPKARELCEKIIKYLDHRFRYRDFKLAYKKHVRDVVTYIADAEDALNVLVDIGVIGRVVEKKSDRYISAEFAYTAPSKVIFTKDSEFCIHPAFLGAFGADENIPDPPFAVYPIGSDPNDPDYREI